MWKKQARIIQVFHTPQKSNVLREKNDFAYPPPDNLQMMERDYANEIDIHSWYKNDIKQKVNISDQVFEGIELKINHFET